MLYDIISEVSVIRDKYIDSISDPEAYIDLKEMEKYYNIGNNKIFMAGYKIKGFSKNNSLQTRDKVLLVAGNLSLKERSFINIQRDELAELSMTDIPGRARVLYSLNDNDKLDEYKRCLFFNSFDKIRFKLMSGDVKILLF